MSKRVHACVGCARRSRSRLCDGTERYNMHAELDKARYSNHSGKTKAASVLHSQVFDAPVSLCGTIATQS